MNLASLLEKIVNSPRLHGLWINTLSYLENCGARKIASCEHPTLVKEEMLKHAAEEFRHAFYLKSQLARIGQELPDYRLSSLLGGFSAYHYLHRLDLETSRYLSHLSIPHRKELSYLLVTYAIELRAAHLYPLYNNVLRHARSKVQVQSILLEEKEHLQEMESALAKIPHSPAYIAVVSSLEARLFELWIKNLLP